MSTGSMTSTWRIDALWYGLSFTLIAALGALNLYMPFVADQAELMLGAQVLAGGGTLYADFWTNKMPAPYWFYQAAGSTFGWSEKGIHLFELGYMLTFSAVLVVTLRRQYWAPWLAALAPVAIIGTYYAMVVATDMTLVEVLIGFPLYLSLWCASRCDWHSRTTRRYAFASGVFAGITVSFKLVFAPVLVAAWLVIAWQLAAASSEVSLATRLRQIVLRGALPIAAGVVLVIAGVVIHFWQRGALPDLLWTAFTYPGLALEEAPPAPIRRLFESIGFLLSACLAWSGFVLVAIVDWWRGDRDRLTSVLLVWVVVAVPLLLIQRFSWWQYHMYVLFTPIGLLGVKGFSVVVGWLLGDAPRRSWRTAGLCLLLAVPPVGGLAIPVRDKITPFVFAFVRHDGTMLDYQSIFRPKYRRIFESTRFLRRRESLKGPIYVFGSPMYHHFGKRESVVPIPGWGWHFLLDEQWAALEGQLASARVPYIFVEKEPGKFLVGQRPAIWEFISENYRILDSDQDGVWFRLATTAGGPSPGS